MACVHIWGFLHQGADDTEHELDWAGRVGIALQLTNILRDLREDAAVGRVYLPEEDFRAAGYSPTELLRGEANPAFLRLMQIEIGRAEEFYAAAKPLYTILMPEGRPIFGLMISTYHALLKKIVIRPADVLLPGPRQPHEALQLALRWMLLSPPEPEKFLLH